MINIFKGVIFDLDGTILDSMPIWEQVDKIFLRENNVEPPNNISDIVKKMTVEQSSQYFIDTFHLPHSQEYVINRIEEIVADQYKYSIQLKDGIINLLDHLDIMNIPYCIATATYSTLAVAALKRLKILKRFKFIITCSDIGYGKTTPEVFLYSAEKLGTVINETIVIEDSLHCIETAVKAGFYTIGVYDKASECDWFEIKKIANKTTIDFSNIKINR